MNFRLMLISCMAVFLSGCITPPQPPIALNRDAVGPQAGRIGIAQTALPKLDTQVPGAACLLCLAAASLANSSLTDHAQSLTYEDLPKLKNEVANLIRQMGGNVLVIDESLNVNELPDSTSQTPNTARKDHTALQKKYDIDRLLVLDISALGFIRTYSSYIPTSDPKSLLQGTGYLVNLKSNSYDWYHSVYVTKSAEQSWDEPPKFPGLTNAYYQAVEIGKDDFLRPFVQAVAANKAKKVDSGTAQPVVMNLKAETSDKK